MIPAMLVLWLQDAGGVSARNTTLLTIFVGLVALAMLIQAVVVLALGIGAMKAQKKLLALAADLKKQAAPAIAKAQDLVEDTVPKVKVITANLVETSHMVRNKVQEFEGTLSTANDTLKEATATFADANMKTRGQISRVDGMITSALKATADIAATVHQSVQTPVRQVAGLVTGFKTTLEALVSKTKTYGGFRK